MFVSIIVCCSSKSKKNPETIINLEILSTDSLSLKNHNKNYLIGKFDYKSDSSFGISGIIKA